MVSYFIFAKFNTQCSSLIGVFSESLLILFRLVCVFKASGFFLVARTISKREFKYSLKSGAISPRLLVTKNKVLISVDYTESYKHKQQREIQSVYFGHKGSVYSPRVAIFVILRICNDQASLELLLLRVC